jgi:hypothetical protein
MAKSYPSGITDDEWDLLRPHRSSAKKRGRRRLEKEFSEVAPAIATIAMQAEASRSNSST